MIADLHTHTTASDGILRPDELVSRAKLHGVDLLAITDHDTLAGLPLAQEVANASDITLVAGIELSCLWQGRGIHIVGLNVDVACPTLNAGVVQQGAVREKRARIIAERLEKAGITGAYEGAKAIAGEAELGRPHFAQFLLATGAVRSAEQAFKRYLGAGKLGDVKQDWPSIEQAVAWVHAAGGRAVVAHPVKYKLTRTKLRELLADFKACGGDALEVISGLQTPNITRDMGLLCRQFELLASCGSDFHSPNFGWQALGGFGKLASELTPVWHDWRIAS
ncbi:MAG TPA: PHP domain-containing protein [Marinagarivorans sp.]